MNNSPQDERHVGCDQREGEGTSLGDCLRLACFLRRPQGEPKARKYVDVDPVDEAVFKQKKEANESNKTVVDGQWTSMVSHRVPTRTYGDVCGGEVRAVSQTADASARTEKATVETSFTENENGTSMKSGEEQTWAAAATANTSVEKEAKVTPNVRVSHDQCVKASLFTYVTSVAIYAFSLALLPFAREGCAKQALWPLLVVMSYSAFFILARTQGIA